MAGIKINLNIKVRGNSERDDDDSPKTMSGSGEGSSMVGFFNQPSTPISNSQPPRIEEVKENQDVSDELNQMSELSNSLSSISNSIPKEEHKNPEPPSTNENEMVGGFGNTSTTPIVSKPAEETVQAPKTYDYTAHEPTPAPTTPKKVNYSYYTQAMEKQLLIQGFIAAISVLFFLIATIVFVSSDIEASFLGMTMKYGSLSEYDSSYIGWGVTALVVSVLFMAAYLIFIFTKRKTTPRLAISILLIIFTIIHLIVSSTLQSKAADDGFVVSSTGINMSFTGISLFGAIGSVVFAAILKKKYD